MLGLAVVALLAGAPDAGQASAAAIQRVADAAAQLRKEVAALRATTDGGAAVEGHFANIEAPIAECEKAVAHPDTVPPGQWVELRESLFRAHARLLLLKETLAKKH